MRAQATHPLQKSPPNPCKTPRAASRPLQSHTSPTTRDLSPTATLFILLAGA
ncbi:hypothetical protein EXIGLDRAFT_782478 [Exidia glandulosa HHB12029]|uniref:Uncharacterized protein n=1 Tax=Exidia glandulosa HHB12029 TaxID=1314781 RepID=A0A165ART9_EXIGL|nr:hypothetical protein EXIGLDRAFT_782478 [Exidia glandulosa HHB12029]